MEPFFFIFWLIFAVVSCVWRSAHILASALVSILCKCSSVRSSGCMHAEMDWRVACDCGMDSELMRMSAMSAIRCRVPCYPTDSAVRPRMGVVLERIVSVCGSLYCRINDWSNIRTGCWVILTYTSICVRVLNNRCFFSVLFISIDTLTMTSIRISCSIQWASNKLRQNTPSRSWHTYLCWNSCFIWRIFSRYQRNDGCHRGISAIFHCFQYF